MLLMSSITWVSFSWDVDYFNLARCYLNLKGTANGISALQQAVSLSPVNKTYDKNYLAQTYGEKLGKANVTGYCIKFKTLKDIDIDILEAAIRYYENEQYKKHPK